MKNRAPLAIAAALLTVALAARGGHELAVYPSYYPHWIAIETVPAERAAAMLTDAKIHAYLGPEPSFPGGVPKTAQAVESLGSIVTLHINPASPRPADEASACAAVAIVGRGLAGAGGFVFHPYPVTPFHGDYLYHLDRAEAAKARFLALPADAPPPSLKVRSEGALAALVRPEWRTQGPDWDAAIEAADAAGLVARAATPIDGGNGPPWIKTGWFQAATVLSDAIVDPETRARTADLLRRLETGDYRDPVERINLERDLVAGLAGDCRKMVIGYTLKRSYFNADFNDGIENVGFDSTEGLDSPMFIRTVKLKNFPWNGWLALGIAAPPEAAWNPIAGFGDAFGRLLWSAVGDAALLPTPYDSGWMLNRISDVRSSAGR